MGDNRKFDYYYGIEADQFSFYRVPRLLVKDARFRELSSDAKLLYGLMLDRMSLSMKNNWHDEENRAYIYYTMENIMEDLGCAKEKCSKVLAELDSKKGYGLIEKKRQGLGKPDIIYVMNFATIENDDPNNNQKEPVNADNTTEVRKSNFKKFENQTSVSSKIKHQEVRESNLSKFGNQTLASSENEPQEVRKANANYTDTNYTDLNYTNPIYPSREFDTRSSHDGDDRMDMTNVYMEIIKENIEYDHHMQYDEWNNKDMFQELYEVICEVVCVPRKTIKVAGEDYPYELVKSKFLKLNSSHLDYVTGCMKDTKTKINNIKAYMVTALYNAPSTMNHFYQQEVQHDMYGGGWHEKGIV
jgi:hypothetical protein